MHKVKQSLRRWWLPILLTVAGGIGGWLYYSLVGCVTGTCPIAASPIRMPIYGAVIGFLLGYGLQPQKKEPPKE